MKILMGIMVMVSAVAAVDNYYRLPSPHRYSCIEGKCNREAIITQYHNDKQQTQQYTTLAECNLVCGKYGSLWPRPSKDVRLAHETIPFLPQNIRFTQVSTNSPKVKGMLHEQAHYFMRHLHFMHPDYKKEDKVPFTEYQEKYSTARYSYQYRFDQHLDAQFDIFQHENRLHKQDFEIQKQFQSLFNNPERNATDIMTYEAVSPFNYQQSSPLAKSQKFDIDVTVTGSETELSIDTVESYSLELETNEGTTTARILADSYYGTRHAMETLSQLIAYNGHTNSLQVVKTAHIFDEPAFKYRGIMLDTGRNFYPKEEILVLLDTMATNKLNTFHWHISDASSFPMFSLRQVQMSYYGAYSPRKIYYPKDIQEIVEYANQRGIRVIPELDAPAHAGAGWNFGEIEGKGKLVLCHNPEDIWFNHCNEPPCGHLNPANSEVFQVLKNVYSDMLEAFNPELFHMGGYDTSFECWSKSPETVKFLTEQNREINKQELSKLWYEFQNRAYAKLAESRQETGVSNQIQPMIYSSLLVRDLMSQKYIVQIIDEVNSTTIEKFISKGFTMVFSNADVWNFEGPAPSWISKAETYKKDILQPSWKQVYENSPLDILTALGVQNVRKADAAGSVPANQVLGGEAMVWSYQTDAESLQPTVWPRGAALAERLWADPSQNQFQADRVEYRMASHQERMVNRGIRAKTFQPEYCFQNQNACSFEELQDLL